MADQTGKAAEPNYAKVALSDLIRLLTNSRIVDPARFIAHGRELAADLNLPCIPVGAGNSKTGVPGTYRPVGPSCPSCPLDAGCYARFGPVGLHQARASIDALAGATAAAIAIIAALRMGTAARLHVSGDFYANGQLSTEYLGWLIHCAAVIQKNFQVATPVAWSYTHVDRVEFEPWRLKLAEVGIEVLYSGQPSCGGAVVWPHDRLAELRSDHPRLSIVACPAQTRSLNCRDCGLCWNAWSKQLCIAFDPHGRGANRLPQP
jgi:hypothetical protein